MRPGAKASFAATSAATLSLAGVTSCGSPSPQPFGTGTDEGSASAASPFETARLAESGTEATVLGGPGVPPATIPTSGSESAARRVEWVGEVPSNGVFMSNAAAPKEGRPSDRVEPIFVSVEAHRGKFLRCIEAWARDHAPERDQRILFEIVLSPEGSVQSTRIDPSQSDFDDAATADCLGEVSQTISFPPSPSGKVTTYRHPFHFRLER